MSKPYRTAGANSAKMRIVIETETAIGTGVMGAGVGNDDPVRLLYQYFDLDGTLLAKRDPYLEETIFPPEGGR